MLTCHWNLNRGRSEGCADVTPKLSGCVVFSVVGPWFKYTLRKSANCVITDHDRKPPSGASLYDSTLSWSMVQTHQDWYVSTWLRQQLWVPNGGGPAIMTPDRARGWMWQWSRWWSHGLSGEAWQTIDIWWTFDIIYTCTDCPWFCSCSDLWNLAWLQRWRCGCGKNIGLD